MHKSTNIKKIIEGNSHPIKSLGVNTIFDWEFENSK